MVYVDFTLRNGNNIAFYLEGNELHGGNTSAGNSPICILKKQGF
jgi:hypothetical protein